ncbi:MAG: hypothetical protein GY737_13940 [Desulfobacteraceae bacterium]|nr:hypothetical protein [Desulfobacteraceae bacterium]
MTIIGCEGGDGDGSAENKVFNLPTEESSWAFLKNNNLRYNVTDYNLSSGEKLYSGTGEIWGKQYTEKIDGIERKVSELLMDIVINGTSQTFYKKAYPTTEGTSWYEHDYETKKAIEERLYSSPEASAKEGLDSLPDLAEVGDFGDLPDYKVIDDSYSFDVAVRVEKSWRLVSNGGNAGLVIMATSYNRYDDKIEYEEQTYAINEHGEILGAATTTLNYRENTKTEIKISR